MILTAYLGLDERKCLSGLGNLGLLRVQIDRAERHSRGAGYRDPP